MTKDQKDFCAAASAAVAHEAAASRRDGEAPCGHKKSYAVCLFVSLLCVRCVVLCSVMQFYFSIFWQVLCNSFQLSKSQAIGVASRSCRNLKRLNLLDLIWIPECGIMPPTRVVQFKNVIQEFTRHSFFEKCVRDRPYLEG